MKFCACSILKFQHPAEVLERRGLLKLLVVVVIICLLCVKIIMVCRSVLEDPPSVSEGCGGRVTDYRIPDFGMLIKQNSLLPVKVKQAGENPLDKVKERLNRQTKYWPLTISSTLIFNLKQVFVLKI